MKTCDEYQIALDQHRRGLLEPGDAAELEAHAMTCGECSKFSEEIARLDRTLSEESQRAVETIDWAGLTAKLERDLQRQRRGRVRAPILFVPCVVFAAYALNQGWLHALVLVSIVFGVLF